ncbi:MAG TPA: gamma-butyrobetaine hydroxylase-like domain-containing protein, partial [Streptosporangiaceae bacterium]
MTSLPRGPAGAEPPGESRPPDGTREPGRTRERDGTGHPALRGLPAVWLRANCPCADCLDPGSGQRRTAITDLPADVAVAEVVASGTAVEVIFG